MALAPAGMTAHAASDTGIPHDHHHHHILIEPEEDRWRWRRKIRQDKRKLVVYRAAVGILGLVLIALGVVTGPLPGPGGIPLVLLGLAVWSSEFEWAHQLMMWLKMRTAPLPQVAGKQQDAVLGGLLQLLWPLRLCLHADAWCPRVAARLRPPASAAPAWAITRRADTAQGTMRHVGR